MYLGKPACLASSTAKPPLLNAGKRPMRLAANFLDPVDRLLWRCMVAGIPIVRCAFRAVPSPGGGNTLMHHAATGSVSGVIDGEARTRFRLARRRRFQQSTQHRSAKPGSLFAPAGLVDRAGLCLFQNVILISINCFPRTMALNTRESRSGFRHGQLEPRP